VIMILIGKYIYYFFDIFNLGSRLTTLFVMSANVIIAGILLMITGIIKLDDILNFHDN